MKKLIIILILLISLKGISQPIINRSGAGNTVQDARWMGHYNLFTPRYSDTTAANIAFNLGIDSSAAIIYTYDINGLWFRQSSPKAWVKFAAGGSGPTGSFWNIGGNLIPVTVNPAFKLGTLAPYGGAIGFTTSGIIRMILPDGGLLPFSSGTDSIIVRDINGNLGLSPKGTASNAWNLAGNSGTTAGTNFIGTTDAQDLVFDRNSVEGFRLGTSGIGISKTSPTSKLDIKTDAIAVTQNDANGIILENTTAATSGAKQQMSPGIVWSGHAWKNTGSASQLQKWRADILPVNSTIVTSSSTWQLSASQNGDDPYHNILQLTSAGALSVFLYSSSTTHGTINGMALEQTPLTNIILGGRYNSLATGVNNVSVGNGLQNITSGSQNVSVGVQTMTSDTSGTLNTAVGYQSLESNLSGGINVAIGATAMTNHISGDKNVAIGPGSMENDLTGTLNTVVGQDGLLHSTSSAGNSGVGWEVLGNVTTGINNSAVGYNTGISITTGSYNSFFGRDANNTKVDAVGSGAFGYLASGTRDSEMVYGASWVKYSIMNGALRLPKYGSGTNTGTPTYGLAVDASGNTIEVALGTGALTGFTTFGSTPNANGGSVSGANIILQPADGTHPGGVSTTTQSIAGDKTLLGTTTITTASTSDSTDKAASTKYVKQVIAALGSLIIDATGVPIAKPSGINVILKSVINGVNTTANNVSDTTFKIDLSGIVPVSLGGIGVGTLASNGVLYGNGTGAVQALAVNSTGTPKVLQNVSSGAPTWVDPTTFVPAGVPLNNITAATGTNTIDNTNKQQTWNWSTTIATTALVLQGTSNNQTGGDFVDITFSGVNNASSVTTKTLFISNARTGAGSPVNIAASFSATAATNNYAIIVPASSGSVGIGTSTPTTLLHVNGSFATGYVAKTANYTLTISDYTVNASSGTFTFTLPTAVSITGRMYVIKNSGSGVITIATTSSQTIDGVTTKTLNTQYSGMTVQSDGSNWVVIGVF